MGKDLSNSKYFINDSRVVDEQNQLDLILKLSNKKNGISELIKSSLNTSQDVYSQSYTVIDHTMGTVIGENNPLKWYIVESEFAEVRRDPQLFIDIKYLKKGDYVSAFMESKVLNTEWVNVFYDYLNFKELGCIRKKDLREVQYEDYEVKFPGDVTDLEGNKIGSLSRGEPVKVVTPLEKTPNPAFIYNDRVKIAYGNGFGWYVELDLIKESEVKDSEGSGEDKALYIVHYPTTIIDSKGELKVEISAGSKVEVVNPIETMEHNIFKYVKIIYGNQFMWIREHHITKSEEGVGYATWITNKQTDYFDMNWVAKGKYNAGQDVKVILPRQYETSLTGEKLTMILHNDIAHWIAAADVNEPKGSGQPAITTDWLRLYSNPTVSSYGRPVARHPNANQLDWGMPEELKGDVADNLLPARARAITGLTPIKMSNNGYMDDEGRYWVAVGPNVMNPDYSNTSKVTDKDMMYGTKIDIHVVEQHDNNKHYYIPAVVGDVKNHTHPDGLYQTGIELVTHTITDNDDGSTVEFIGYEILNKFGVYDPAGENSSINITNNYRLIEILVYDNVMNYNPLE